VFHITLPTMMMHGHTQIKFKMLFLIKISEHQDATFREELVKMKWSIKIVYVEKFNVINIYKVRFLILLFLFFVPYILIT
jgi:hypothetical protein